MDPEPQSSGDPLPPRSGRGGLIHNRTFLQYSFIVLLGVAALLFWLLRSAWDESAALGRQVEALKHTKERKFWLRRMLEHKPEAFRRNVILAFLREIYPEADGYGEKALAKGGTYFEVSRGGEVLGYAELCEMDIECDVCLDLEIFVGVGLTGRVSGFAPVESLDHSPDAERAVSETLQSYLGKDSEGVGGIDTVSGATKTSRHLKEAVQRTLERLRDLR